MGQVNTKRRHRRWSWPIICRVNPLKRMRNQQSTPLEIPSAPMLGPTKVHLNWDIMETIDLCSRDDQTNDEINNN